jgi:hypothetical protein
MAAEVTLLPELPDRPVVQGLLTFGAIGTHRSGLLSAYPHGRAAGWPAQEADGPSARDLCLPSGAGAVDIDGDDKPVISRVPARDGTAPAENMIADSRLATLAARLGRPPRYSQRR